MPRPVEIPPEFISSCRQDFDASPVPGPFKKGLMGTTLFEAWLSGAWLRKRLTEMGCEEEPLREILLAFGRACYGRDPWSAVEGILEDFRKLQVAESKE